MYKFMLIILSLVVILFSSSCAPYPVVAKTSGLPLGTVITLGGKKMIVVSQENEKVRLKPYKSAVVKTPVVVKTVEPIPEGPKPEWESKKVVTEGVKNVQECLNPMGCPQDVKTGECLEGCSEQKVQIEIEILCDLNSYNFIIPDLLSLENIYSKNFYKLPKKQQEKQKKEYSASKKINEKIIKEYRNKIGQCIFESEHEVSIKFLEDYIFNRVSDFFKNPGLVKTLNYLGETK